MTPLAVAVDWLVALPWEPFAWAAVALFALAWLWHWHGTEPAERLLSTLGWGALALLWVVLLPYFWLEARSPIETVLVGLAVPLSLWAGWVRWRGRESLVVLGKAAAIAGLLYLPVHTVEPARRWLIETVAAQTHWLMGLLGYQPGLAAGPEAGYLSLFAFDAHTTYIVLACTGIGSISIFSGVLLAVSAPLGRRLAGAVAVGAVIYGLNLVRNVFVGLATPLGIFNVEPFVTIAGLFGVEGTRVSFFTSHTLIAQPLSVVVLVGLLLVAVRLVPEVFTVLDEVVYLLTGDEVDLREEFGPRILGESSGGGLDAAD
ncbi:MAG: archaeosortase A [Halobacteriales archaeon]